MGTDCKSALSGALGLGEGWRADIGNPNEEQDTNGIVNQIMVENGQPEKQRLTYNFPGATKYEETVDEDTNEPSEIIVDHKKNVKVPIQIH